MAPPSRGVLRASAAPGTPAAPGAPGAAGLLQTPPMPGRIGITLPPARAGADPPCAEAPPTEPRPLPTAPPRWLRIHSCVARIRSIAPEGAMPPVTPREAAPPRAEVGAEMAPPSGIGADVEAAPLRAAE